MIRLFALAVMWVCSVAIVGVWQRHDGRMASEASWQAKSAQEAAIAAREIRQAQQAARHAEQLSASRLVSVSEDFQRKLTNAKRTHQADLDAVRAGTLRLRDPGSASMQAGADRAAEVGSSPGRCDGPEARDLSNASAEFLLELASDADQIAEQLAACQQIVRVDREGR